MDMLNQTRFLERLQFFNGQRLFAADLQGLEAFNREMRWLHNQSLHQPGIGTGLAVNGKTGGREVTIMPGYAIDAQGREIVLTENWVEPVPPVANELTDEGDITPALYDLTVSYPDDTQLEEVETRAGICLDRGVVRRREQPVFCWVRLKNDGQPKDDTLKQDVLVARKIILARAEILNCQLNKDLSFAQRRSARPAKQPYVACGAVQPDWQLIKGDEDIVLQATQSSNPIILSFKTGAGPNVEYHPILLTAEIKTDSARFITTPCYSVRLAGERVKEKIFIVDGLVEIVDPQPGLFKVQVLIIVQALQSPGTLNINIDLFDDWQVEWIGIEG